MHQLHRTYVVSRRAIEDCAFDLKAFVEHDCRRAIQDQAMSLTDRFVTDYHRWHYFQVVDGEWPNLDHIYDGRSFIYDHHVDDPNWTHAILLVWTRPFTQTLVPA